MTAVHNMEMLTLDVGNTQHNGSSSSNTQEVTFGIVVTLEFFFIVEHQYGYVPLSDSDTLVPFSQVVLMIT